jgi:hypothetical protein
MAVSTEEILKLIRGNGKSKVEVEVEGKEDEEMEDEEKPALSGAESPPMASPMSTPEPKKGEEMQGRIDVQLGLGMLMGALQKFPDDSKEAKALTDVIRSLGQRLARWMPKQKNWLRLTSCK